MLVDEVKDWRSPWLFCAFHVSQEGEPEETAETDVDGPQTSRHEFEVDGLKDWPNQDPGLGRGKRVLIVVGKVLEEINGMTVNNNSMPHIAYISNPLLLGTIAW